jgi:hypothetical protein
MISDEPVEYLSIGGVVEQVKKLLKPFATEVPISIIDRTGDVLPAKAFKNDEVFSGFTFRGSIYLVREGLVEHATVQRTASHGLLQSEPRHDDATVYRFDCEQHRPKGQAQDQILLYEKQSRHLSARRADRKDPSHYEHG